MPILVPALRNLTVYAQRKLGPQGLMLGKFSEMYSLSYRASHKQINTNYIFGTVVDKQVLQCTLLSIHTVLSQ